MKKKNALKNTLLTILYFFSLSNLNGQEIRKIFEPIFPNYNPVEKLDTTQKIIDVIRFNGQLVHMKLEFEEDTTEYFKVTDSLFFFRQISNKNPHNEGYYKFSNQINWNDTILIFDPETYEEKMIINSYFETQQYGEWKETSNDSVFWTGRYNEGLKVGRWFKSIDKINFPKYGEFENGELVTLYNPEEKDFRNNLNWILNKPFILSLVSFHHENTGETEYWWIEKEIKEGKYDFGTIIFEGNGKFEYNHNPQYQIATDEFDGVGNWEIKKEGLLELKFENGELDLFSVEVLSSNKILLKKRKR